MVKENDYPCPFENACFDENGFLIDSSERFDQSSENVSSQTDENISKQEQSPETHQNRILLNTLKDRGKWHAFCCATLGVIGSVSDLKSLKNADEQYPKLKDATDEIYELGMELGWFDDVLDWDIKSIQRAIIIFVGVSPLFGAVMEEIKNKGKDKTIPNIGGGVVENPDVENSEVVDVSSNSPDDNSNDEVDNDTDVPVIKKDIQNPFGAVLENKEKKHV